MKNKTCLTCNVQFEVDPHRAEIAMYCSRKCHHKGTFLKTINNIENDIGESLKSYLEREYAGNKRTYRWLQKELNINNRTVRKLLEHYCIAIRRGSEAVKTQWIDNEKRRIQQGQVFSDSNKGKPSPKRLDIKVIEERYLEYGLIVLSRDITDVKNTIVTLKCLECGKTSKKALANASMNCVYCQARKGIAKMKKTFEEVEAKFHAQGLTLLESEYVNTKTKMAFLCTKHSIEGVMYASYNDMRERGACMFCRADERNKYKQKNIRHKMKMHLRRWRIAVLKRDNHQCQCCGKMEGSMSAHHIKNFSSHPHLRLDVENGITLCDACHNPIVKGSFHDVYGVYNNTPEQLEEYIKQKQKSLA